MQRGFKFINSRETIWKENGEHRAEEIKQSVDSRNSIKSIQGRSSK